jgi:hypothetical protein
MPEIMVRVEVGDFNTWLRTHRANAENRLVFGMVDGPIYRDIDNSSAVLVHTHAEDLERAGQWFQTDAFKEASRQSTAVWREFYIAHKQGTS